jgi:hypothetical protein
MGDNQSYHMFSFGIWGQSMLGWFCLFTGLIFHLPVLWWIIGFIILLESDEEML